jgi:hypothetical protein
MQLNHFPESASSGKQPVRQWTVLQALDNLLAESIGYVHQHQRELFEALALNGRYIGTFVTRAEAALAVRAAHPEGAL